MQKQTEIRKADHSSVPPLIDGNSDTLVLGSMLSPKSAQARFYYAHPQNRFWRVLAAVFDESTPASITDKKTLALSHRIALWDVIGSCDIVGASDSTIKNVKYNDIIGLLDKYKSITRIFTTGGKAHELLLKYNAEYKNPLIEKSIRLPSTSPQNCRLSFDELLSAYSFLRQGKSE